MVCAPAETFNARVSLLVLLPVKASVPPFRFISVGAIAAIYRSRGCASRQRHEGVCTPAPPLTVTAEAEPPSTDTAPPVSELVTFREAILVPATAAMLAAPASVTVAVPLAMAESTFSCLTPETFVPVSVSEPTPAVRFTVSIPESLVGVKVPSTAT